MGIPGNKPENSKTRKKTNIDKLSGNGFSSATQNLGFRRSRYVKNGISIFTSR
ncbi:hypothetical protein HanRHA438_Chr13g0612691 [Helianthus annuus]|nr:hypothetical protein HanRHA438_Chr13g0612691 [Helianthus annuus]